MSFLHPEGAVTSMKNKDQAGLGFLGIQAIIWSWIRSADPRGVYPIPSRAGSMEVVPIGILTPHSPPPPPKKKWFWSLGKFLEKCWICSWDWSLGKLPQKWWAQLQHWIFHGFRDHSHPQGLGDLGSISGYPKFCSSWKTAQELCPHPWELLWIPLDFPSLSFNSLSLQGELLDSNCSSLGNSQIHKKYL